MEDKGQILLYQTPDGESRIEVRLQGETVWLNQEQMAELFQRNISTISRHIYNAFEEGEQKRNAQSIEVNGIGFRADKELISKTDRECDLERGGVSRLKVSKYSLEERIVLAKKYLENHVMMRVGDYAALTGLSHSKASIELRELCERPDAGFKAQGRGSHRVYIKRDE